METIQGDYSRSVGENVSSSLCRWIKLCKRKYDTKLKSDAWPQFKHMLRYNKLPIIVYLWLNAKIPQTTNYCIPMT